MNYSLCVTEINSKLLAVNKLTRLLRLITLIPFICSLFLILFFSRYYYVSIILFSVIVALFLIGQMKAVVYLTYDIENGKLIISKSYNKCNKGKEIFSCNIKDANVGISALNPCCKSAYYTSGERVKLSFTVERAKEKHTIYTDLYFYNSIIDAKEGRI